MPIWKINFCSSVFLRLSELARCKERPQTAITISASYAVNNIGGGTRKVISDLNGSLGSR